MFHLSNCRKYFHRKRFVPGAGHRIYFTLFFCPQHCSFTPGNQALDQYATLPQNRQLSAESKNKLLALNKKDRTKIYCYICTFSEPRQQKWRVTNQINKMCLLTLTPKIEQS
jgi:hypothetical protein